jgi:protein-S-isoprenylcysteine O-methyltransferase Ste14
MYNKNSMDIPIPPIIFIMSFTIAYILYGIYPIVRFSHFDIVSLIFIILGISISMYSIYIILKNKTTLDPNKAPSKLIKTGIFKISRNPIYLSMIIILFGLDLYFFSIISFIDIIIFFLIINFYIIPKEEVNIGNKFGSEYIEYKKSVNRWI